MITIFFAVLFASVFAGLFVAAFREMRERESERNLFQADLYATEFLLERERRRVSKLETHLEVSNDLVTQISSDYRELQQEMRELKDKFVPFWDFERVQVISIDTNNSFVVTYSSDLRIMSIEHRDAVGEDIDGFMFPRVEKHMFVDSRDWWSLGGPEFFTPEVYRYDFDEDSYIWAKDYGPLVEYHFFHCY